MASICMPAIGVSAPFPVEEKGRKKESASCLVIGKPIGEGPLTLIDQYDWDRIFDVIGARILRLGTEKYAQLVGTIDLHYAYGILHIYESDKASAMTVHLPGELKLTTPNLGISGYARIFIYFNLEGDFEELNDSHFCWWPGDHPCDEIITRINDEEKCSVELTYIVHSEAIIADLEIKVHMHKRKFDTGIYGKVTATFTKMEGVKFDLFKEEREDSVCVGEENFNVPLSRSLIIVPYGNALDIQVDVLASRDVPIADGIVRFEPTYHGEHMGMICGEYGEVEVKVTFWCYDDHPETKKDYTLKPGLKKLFL